MTGTLPRILDVFFKGLLNSEWGLWGSILLCIGLLLYLIYKSVLYAAFLLRAALLTSIAVVILLGATHLWLTKFAPVYLVLSTGEKGSVEPILIYGLDQARNVQQATRHPGQVELSFIGHHEEDTGDAIGSSDADAEEPDNQPLSNLVSLQLNQGVREARCESTDGGCSIDLEGEEDGDVDPYESTIKTGQHDSDKKKRKKKQETRIQEAGKEGGTSGSRQAKQSPAKSNVKEEPRAKDSGKKEKKKQNSKPTSSHSPPTSAEDAQQTDRFQIRRWLPSFVTDLVARIMPWN